MRAMFVGNAPAQAVAAAKKAAVTANDISEPPPTRDIVREAAPPPAPREQPDPQIEHPGQST